MASNSVVVVGSGSWGTALANVFADAGNTVTLWGRDGAVAAAVNEQHENPKYLKGLKLNPVLRATTDLVAACDGAAIIVCSIPTQQIRNVFAPIAGRLKGKILVNTSKGIEIGTHLRVSQIFGELAEIDYVMLSGPSFAQETVSRLPTAVTVAGTNAESTALVQKTSATPYFRAYRSSDVIGVELAGALKNVIAIASGVVTGLRLGYNAQAAIINRGIAEMSRMGKALGADPMTFLGLAGMGDLVLTCTGPLSRNRRLGVGLGEGKKIDEVIQELGGVAEGYYTAKSGYELAEKHGVEMPIADQVHRILYHGSTAQRALTELMSRDLKEEWA